MAEPIVSRGTDRAGRPLPTAAPAPVFTDAEVLDQIAAVLGLYNTDPSNNPVDELIADINGYVTDTGRSVNTPEGA